MVFHKRFVSESNGSSGLGRGVARAERVYAKSIEENLAMIATTPMSLSRKNTSKFRTSLNKSIAQSTKFSGFSHSNQGKLKAFKRCPSESDRVSGVNL
mmetsp:Transcript_13309/g.14706  ORF Transcript_13309/g.14706 Transcript_13309/m.14706 type:complete len:98 (-) Transcript_13309:387-680(-)